VLLVVVALLWCAGGGRKIMVVVVVASIDLALGTLALGGENQHCPEY
jgi:hypothetical protein